MIISLPYSIKKNDNPYAGKSVMAGWLRGGNGWADRQTDRQTKNLPILQNFVPYWGLFVPKKTKKI